MHCPAYNINLCVLCYCLFFSDVYMAKMEDSISTIYKGFLSQKYFQLFYFCVV